MKSLVAYTSKYGSTKQYAEWIAAETGADVREARNVSDADIVQYDVVVCGCYLHIGTYVGVEFLKEHWTALKDKKIGLFTVSGAPASSPEQQKWFEDNIPADMRTHITHFPMQGRAMGLDLKDRMLIAFPRAMTRLAYWRNPTPENKKAVESFKPFDGVKREYIQPVVDFIKSAMP